MFKTYKEFINHDLFLMPFGDHGVGHTRRVLYLALKLANKYELTEEEKKILAVACCYHDIGRVNDETDDGHGLLSVRKCERLKLQELHDMNDEDWYLVRDLIIFHSLYDFRFPRDDERSILMYKILKDADALDRLRFKDLDVKFLRLDYSRELIDLEFRLLIADKVIKV